MSLISLFLTTSLIAVRSQSPVTVYGDSRSGSGYYSLMFTNINPSSCGDTIKNVAVKTKNGNYVNNFQYYWEPSDNKDRYAFSSNDFDNGGGLPFSVKFIFDSGGELELTDIITNVNSNSVFTATGTFICDRFVPPTPQPTTRTPTAPTTPRPTYAEVDSMCINVNTEKIDWRSYGNQLILNNNRFNMKGLNWFGYETPNNGLYGLDRHSEDWYFQFMRDNKFNAMRLPFASDWLFSGTSLNSGNFAKYKATISKAGEYGIFVMPDMHSKTIGSWTDGLNTISKTDAIKQWKALAEGLKDEWNVFIADIFNEPHDVENSQWGEWIQFCEDAAEEIWSVEGNNWLIGVEGTNWQCSVISCAWGENLEGVRDQGITFDLESHGENRFVWAHHVYGPDVTGGGYSKAGWQAHWGYLFDGTFPSNEAAGLIGEFGTTYNNPAWLDSLVNYLIEIDQRNTFYWCLNPNSGDTGGVLKSDWTTPETGKLAALDKLQPNPSRVTYNKNTGNVCISFDGSGSMATPSPTTTTTKAPTTTTTKAPTTKAPTVRPGTPTTTRAPTTRAPTTKTPTSGGGGGSNGDSITVKPDGASQAYYLQLIFNNADASGCGGAISEIYLLVNNQWIAANNKYNDPSKGDIVADWNYRGTKFTDMLPISLKIEMRNGDEIELPGVVTAFNGAEYTSDESICGDNAYNNDEIDDAAELDARGDAVETAAIITCVCIIICCIIAGIGYFIYRKKNKNKAIVDMDGGDTTPTADDVQLTETKVNDGGMTETNQTNIIAMDDEEDDDDQ